MRVELTEMLWFEEHAVSLSELAELTGLSPATLEELVSSGAIEPIDASSPEPRFGAAALGAARHARRLREDFDLDTQALPLVLGLLERIDGLERQLQALRARLPGRIR
ncbi:MAG: chaperone modulator CbpM [Steroidobacteraceae bacterium]|jgi:chaperone modulatory protein CbpM